MKKYDNHAVLITKHNKEAVIKPLVEHHLHLPLHVIHDIDTDRFGTFSREIKRKKPQLDTARLKIKAAHNQSKARYVIASEGSFGSHPMLPIPWNVELVVMVDFERKVEVIGVCENAKTNFAHQLLSTLDELLMFARECQFPSHGVLLRPDHEKHAFIIKDVDNEQALTQAFQLCLQRSKTHKVFVETDMRAHRNPMRMANIEKATQHMLANYLSVCPQCSCPGFVVTQTIKGLPCEVCSQPTHMVLEHLSVCKQCKFTLSQKFPKGQTCPAQYCDYCNP